MSNEKINTEQELKRNSVFIEAILQSFGIFVRVDRADDYKEYTKYFLSLSMGTSIQDLLKLDKDLASGLSSPTGNIEIQAPIPNSSQVGITVPKNEKYDKKITGALLHSYKMDFERTFLKPIGGWRGNTSHYIYTLGSLLIQLSAKINRNKLF